MTFQCPICKLAIERNVESFPFCSERCRMIDLGNWSDGSYAIPAEPTVDPEASEERLH